jgi:hypothetical protein
MRTRTPLALLLALAGLASCRLIIDYEEALPICGPHEKDCIPCIISEDECGTPPACKRWVCVAARCRAYDADVGTPCPGGGYCVFPQSGPECVTCLEDAHCPSGMLCGGGECHRCDDGIQNGDERGVDCGGKDCPTVCTGDICEQDRPCQSGHCADGRCCITACDEICAYCDNDGICQNVPRGEDDAPLCHSPRACSGNGLCLLRDGEDCTSSQQCLSFSCANLKCAP